MSSFKQGIVDVTLVHVGRVRLLSTHDEHGQSVPIRQTLKVVFECVRKETNSPAQVVVRDSLLSLFV